MRVLRQHVVRAGYFYSQDSEAVSDRNLVNLLIQKEVCCKEKILFTIKGSSIANLASLETSGVYTRNSPLAILFFYPSFPSIQHHLLSYKQAFPCNGEHGHQLTQIPCFLFHVYRTIEFSCQYHKKNTGNRLCLDRINQFRPVTIAVE